MTEKKTLSIDLGVTLTSINFEAFISQFWVDSFREENVNIEFSFRTLEWIAYEQLSILTGWMQELADSGKTIVVHLQQVKDILATSDVFRKRQRCLSLIIADWKLGECLGGKITLSSGGMNISPKYRPFPDRPFETIPAIKYDMGLFEDDFDFLYKNHLKRFRSYIFQEIRQTTELNYFDNQFINYSIIKELYSNICQHAFDLPESRKCFVSLFVNPKISRVKEPVELQNALAKRYKERPSEELNFFRGDGSDFRNESYLELTFFDLGKGISETLKGKYINQDKENIVHRLSENHETQHLDSKVLEYAFLLFTSKYELEEDLLIHDYIPRGLYIIKDIVRRYGGMIIARSRKGKVVFDFSRETETADQVVRFRNNDLGNEYDFQGTSITIILPAFHFRPASSVTIEKELSRSPRIRYVNLLKIFIKHYKRITPDDKENERLFYSGFFYELSIVLSEVNLNRGHQLVCFNFAGLSSQSKSFYFKLVYFLSYSPLINEHTNALFFNILDKSIGAALLAYEGNNSIGFFKHVIPCIFPDLDVKWIGIEDRVLSERLTELWKGDTNNEHNVLDRPEFIDGNVLHISRAGNMALVKCRMPEFANIIIKLLAHQVRMIDREIAGNGLIFEDLREYDIDDNVIHDYNAITKPAPENTAYLVSNGQYQTVFLSFIEKLYKREYRRYIATFFLFNFFSKRSDLDITGINKILTVTLSSQLLGKEVKDVLELLNQESRDISLIPLSSYYDFYKEPKFAEIADHDTVLVVNDVISTGYLSSKISSTINKRRTGVDIFILTIVDSRDNDTTNLLNDKIYSLTKHPIKKYQSDELKITGEPIWINPILNAPTTMSIDKSNIQNVLLTPDEFLLLASKSTYYNVGLFLKNNVYHTYYLNTELLFRNIAQFESSDIRLLDVLLQSLVKQKALDKQENLRLHFNGIRATLQNSVLKDDEVLSKDIEQLENRIMSGGESEVKFDFVFYPFLSAISQVDNDLNSLLKEYSSLRSLQIYPVPRIMTPKGWRFTFPPKFLNHMTTDKEVLLIDDGSCSGETIVQMIDTISFLRVKDITVISIFGRLEDYNREFLTRISEIKVKNYTIPINIYFGTNFNIPVFSRSSHPYQTELEDLESYKDKPIPQSVRNYIERRKTQITSNTSNKVPITPLIADFVDKKTMFRIRDIIGKFDSYRLYKEDETLSGNPQGKSTKSYLLDFIDDLDGFDALLAVLSHEPKLINTLNRVFPTIITKIKNKLSELFKDEMERVERNWAFYFRIVSFLDINLLLNFDIIIGHFMRMDASIRAGHNQGLISSIYEAFDYYAFVLYCVYENKLIVFEDVDRVKLKALLSDFLEKISVKTLLGKGEPPFFINSIREFLDDYRIAISSKDQTPTIKAFIEMYNYFFDVLGKDSHPILFSRFQEFYIQYYNAELAEQKESAKTEYNAEIERISGEIFRNINQILKSLKMFKGFIHDFNVDQYIELAASASAGLTTILSETAISGPSTPQDDRVYSNLVEFNRCFLDFHSPFYIFMSKFKCDIFAVSKKIFGKESVRKELRDHGITHKIKYLPRTDSLTILSHPVFFSVILQEIYKNTIKYAQHSNFTLRLELSVNGFLIRYLQSTPKIENKMGERGIRGFRDFASIHGAKFTERNLDSKYEFEFEFPLTLIL